MLLIQVRSGATQMFITAMKLSRITVSLLIILKKSFDPIWVEIIRWIRVPMRLNVNKLLRVRHATLNNPTQLPDTCDELESYAGWISICWGTSVDRMPLECEIGINAVLGVWIFHFRVWSKNGVKRVKIFENTLEQITRASEIIDWQNELSCSAKLTTGVSQWGI